VDSEKHDTEWTFPKIAVGINVTELCITLLLGHYSKGAIQMGAFFIKAVQLPQYLICEKKTFQAWFSPINLKLLRGLRWSHLLKYRHQKVMHPTAGPFL